MAHPRNPASCHGARIFRLDPGGTDHLDHLDMARHAATDGDRSGLMAAVQNDLDHRLTLLISAHADCDLDAMALSARRIRHLALQLGLPELRRAADNALNCRRDANPTALAAVIARLDRLGARALAEVDLARRSVT